MECTGVVGGAVGLPDLVPFEGDWKSYVERLYETFMSEIVNGGLSFSGLPIRTRYHPPSRGKGSGFWHVIQEGPSEDERIPDLRRCERISWISWMIKNATSDDRISWWEEGWGSSRDVLIWLEVEDYLVVLSKRKGYYLLKTAYLANKAHKRKGLRKNREAYWAQKY
jgi:hypothetical protein